MPAVQQRIDWLLLVLRISTGAGLAALHGWSKVTAAAGYFLAGQEWRFVNGVAALGFPFPSAFALAAALAESAGGALLAVGLFTRWSALSIAATMSVAVYRHLRAGEGAELAAMYLVAAAGLAVTGGGEYALDALRQRKPLTLEHSHV